MTYQWATPEAPVFSIDQDGVGIYAQKNANGNSVSLSFALTNIDFEGDTPTDQDIADALGLIVTALEGGGFTVDVGETGTVRRVLEEAP